MSDHTLRRSSVYEIRTAGDRILLKQMMDRVQAQGFALAGSGIDPTTVFVRVRTSNDSEALGAALAACGDQVFTLVTGYGINRREVLSRPPEGCFCQHLPELRGCLTCTCPNCGATGRFGVSIEHEPGCE